MTETTGCKTVIFLGAGFSMEADMPVMSEFGRYSKKELENLPREARTKTLTDAGKRFEAFRKYCTHVPGKGTTRLSADNMEDLFTLAEIMRETDMIQVSLDGYKERVEIETLVRDMRLWLWKIFHRLPVHNPKQNNHFRVPLWDVYEKFAKAVKEYGTGQVSLVTTNYDIIPEYLFYKMGTAVRYPFGIGTPECKDIQLTNKEAMSFFCESNNDAILLCKLHGSTNYFFNDKKSGENTPDFRVSRRWNDKKVLPEIAQLNFMSLLHKEFPDLSPAIIPPTYAKLEGHEWLRATWREARERLEEAKHWMFLGYSLPPSDGFMRSLITSALIAKKEEVPSVTIVDPDPLGQVNDNYSHVFGENVSMERHKVSFSEFVESGDFKYKLRNPNK